MTKVLSITVFAEPSNVTDRQTDRFVITIARVPDLMLRAAADVLASVGQKLHNIGSIILHYCPSCGRLPLQSASES